MRRLVVPLTLLAFSLAKVVALLPISLGGIGLREVALATFLAPFGVPAALAVAQSLVWESILVVVGSAAGGSVLALSWRDRRALGQAP